MEQRGAAESPPPSRAARTRTRRALGAGSVTAALAAALAVFSLALDWATGCALSQRDCGGATGLRALQWRAAIPGACAVVAVAAAARLAHLAVGAEPPRLARWALATSGLLGIAFTQYAYNASPWTEAAAGPGRWGYGPGLYVFLAGAFLMLWAWAKVSPEPPAAPAPRRPEEPPPTS